jgi:hypothetical protein
MGNLKRSHSMMNGAYGGSLSQRVSVFRECQCTESITESVYPDQITDCHHVRCAAGASAELPCWSLGTSAMGYSIASSSADQLPQRGRNESSITGMMLSRDQIWQSISSRC